MVKILHRIFLFILLVITTLTAGAFEPDFYAESSVLSSGKWVKVRVEKSGLYRIPAATLRSWGFSDPAKVRIHGYGGRRIADLLSKDGYADDLPRTLSQVSDDGVVFYAAGTDEWQPSVGSYFHGYLNPYSSHAFYFITESDSVNTYEPATASPGANYPYETGQGRVHYEVETTQATEAGPLFVGENFSQTRTRNFAISTPGRVSGSPVWMECSFVHTHVGSDANLKFTVDGTDIPAVSTDRVSATSDSHYVHASIATTRHSFEPKANERFTLGITYVPTLSNPRAYLDYLSFNYSISLDMPSSGSLSFWSEKSELSLAAPEGTVVWDVTDPVAVKVVKTLRNGNRIEWTATESGMRAYAAWTPTATLSAPAFEENVASQNLHGEGPAEMVIVAPSELLAAATRIAQLHRDNDGMTVLVVDQNKVYNEFSSGTCDIGGIRKFFKCLYDKGADADTPLQYALLMGRATLDQRGILGKQHFAYRTTPWWVVREPRLSMSDNDGFGTDDFVAMLEDGSGTSLGLDRLSIAVGRIPALNAADGNEIVDKLEQYIYKSKKTAWKNRLIVLADDEDNGVHLNQAENMSAYITATDRQQHLIDKIYIDAYDKVGSEYPEARREMFRLLDEGMAWWVFTGHANNHSWTGDGMLTFTDLNNLYLRNLPFLLASTCDFLRWDGNEISGGEIMYKERYGGTISMISATRPVYISDNGFFLNAFGRQALTRDDNGLLVRSGEAYRRTKNDIRNNSGNIVSNTNRLRFVFMGDPAMAVATPSNIVEVTAINGVVPNQENQATIGALGNAVIDGRIVDPDGQLMSGFNGVVNVEIFDADYSVTTLGHGETGKIDVYDRHGEKLFSGSATVKSGIFRLTAAMPSQIADNFREASMSLYAYATDSNDEAVGLCRDFYVYGFDEPEKPDTESPAISSFVLNHAGFTSGDMVNTSPMVIARVEDNVGINLSLAGVGQQMAMTLDDMTFYNDIASYYTPSSDGSPSGIINYPLEGLTEGAHTLRLRVFDTSGNTATAEIDFVVSEKVMPNLFEVYTDANPASTSASFYVRHDRPDSFMDVSVTVYNLLGQPVWTGSSKGMSDMDVSAPVTWNLCDQAGRRVQRGIYLYRASITADGEKYQSASRRIAVTAQ